MDRAVHEHCSANRHYCLDRPLGLAVVMMGSNSGETLHLLKIQQFLRVFVAGESGAVIREIFGYDHSVVPGNALKSFLSLQSLVAV